jgi:hypothetical protein
MHVIHLREPWQLERPATGDVACYRRAFHTPTGLDGGEQVWLVVEPAVGRAIVKLNGQPLGEVQHGFVGRFDVTSLLDDRNALEIDVESGATTGGSIGEVRLEIS